MSSFEVNSFDFNVNENKLKEYFTNVLDFGYSNGIFLEFYFARFNILK